MESNEIMYIMRFIFARPIEICIFLCAVHIWFDHYIQNNLKHTYISNKPNEKQPSHMEVILYA